MRHWVEALTGQPARHGTPSWRETRLFVVSLVMAAIVTGSTPNQPAPQPGPLERPVGRAASCTGRGAPFPRSATVYLAQDRLPPLTTLARYDVVILDSEWGHRRSPAFFSRLRRIDPGVCLLAYVDLVDRPDRLGTPRYWADRYALWHPRTLGTGGFPRRWMAATSTGRLVSEYPGTQMTNLTDHAPRVQGQTYAEYAARWVVNRVWSRGTWDGIYLDVWGDRIYTADVDSWDSNSDRVDEPADAIYGPGGPWARGLHRAEIIMRAGMPGAVLVANGDRSLAAGTLDGRAWESFLDPASGRPVGRDLRHYVTTSAGVGQREPGVSLTINVRRSPAESAEDRRTARFRLAATLMQNGFWAPMGADYGQPAHYPRLLSHGGGYLGWPVSSNPGWSALNAPFHDGVGLVAPNLYRRDFQYGTVLLNTGHRRQTVTLGEAYETAAGTDAGRVSVGPQDGLVLRQRMG